MKDDKNYIKQILGFIIISMIGLLLLNAFVMPKLTSARVKETNYSFFLKQVDDGNVSQVKIEKDEIRFEVVSTKKATLYSPKAFRKPMYFSIFSSAGYCR